MQSYINYKLRDWVDIDKIQWSWLSKNPNAIDLLQQYPDKIDWNWLSENPSAIDILKINFDKIDNLKLRVKPKK